MSRKRRPGEAVLATGLVLAAAFGLAWYLTRGGPWSWLWLFPLVFCGLLPAISDVRRLWRERPEGEPARLAASEAERRFLLAAREARGLVTPALVALKTGLSISWSRWPARDTRSCTCARTGASSLSSRSSIDTGKMRVIDSPSFPDGL